jgi:predicted MFS family arabinose efflux permease
MSIAVRRTAMPSCPHVLGGQMIQVREHPNETAPDGPPRAGRNFALLWAGESVSLVGNATTSLLVPVLAAVHLHAGAGWMGLLASAAWLPWLLIGLPAGAWVDRLEPRQVMIAADVGAAVALLVVPAMSAFGRLGLVELLGVTFAGGVCTVFFRAAYAKLLPRIVPAPALERANGRLFGSESAAQIAGPGLAGLITQVTSAVGGLCLDAVSFMVSAACLFRIHDAHPKPGQPERKTPLRREIQAGIRHVYRDPNLRTITIIGGLSNFGLTGYGALLVLYFVHVLGVAPGAVGLMLALAGAGGLTGALVASPLARRIGTGRASSLLFLIAGASALLIPLPARHAQAPISIVGLALVGAAVIGGNVIRGAWRQRYVPESLMGRVITTSQVINYGTMPLAGLAAGWLGESIGIRATMLVMAGIHTASCLGAVVSPFGRARMLPSRA